ncbi:hypothetical protein [Armatimonas sp.]|uniref:hypothetical protein n=1 Tax=Armatimonas sp. TaxID=1872638 RepID=UPI00286B6BE9|nr:hypothetical protein [Armatimonas sp.]
MDRRSFLQTTALGVWAMNEVEPDQALPHVWELRREGAKDWRPATVPGCWENDGIPSTFSGPVWYRTTAPPAPNNGGARTRLWWEFDAVSYYCEGFADGKKLGEHTGLWDAFAWELPAGTRELTLRVEKPGSVRFPLNQTLAVEAPWGGPWQEARVHTTGPARIAQLWAPADSQGNVAVEAELDLASGTRALVTFLLTDPEGNPVAQAQAEATKSGVVTVVNLTVTRPLLWSPEAPHCYTLTVTATQNNLLSDRQTRTVGFRKVQRDGERILLNEQPIYFRGLLANDGYEKTRAPNPPPEVFEAELKRAKALGFNGIMLSGWVPPRAYFELAARLGVLLWVELPLGPFAKSEAFTKQTLLEYARIVRQIGDHPAILLWTVGGALSRGRDATLTAQLYAVVKKQTYSPLVRDCSGSAELDSDVLEAPPELADYSELLLSCDLPFVRPTYDALAPRWRARQPTLITDLRASSSLVAKHMVELARASPFTAGYTLAGLPEPGEFNADTVLFIEPDRRRERIAGGDRVVWTDRVGAWSSERIRRHVGVSHFGKTLGPGAVLRWKTSTGQSGELTLGPLEAGEVNELGVIEFTPPLPPAGGGALKAALIVELTAAGKTLSKNTWPLWVFGKRVPTSPGAITNLYDPARLLAGFEEVTGWKTLPSPNLGLGGPGIIVATAWSPELLGFARNGGRVLYLQPSAFGGLPALGLPFFREAALLAHDHPSWGSFPYEKNADVLLYGVAPDCAFEPEALQQLLGVPLSPVLTRTDARSAQVHAYVCEVQVGAGKLLLTTLRPYGGLGDQPSGLQHAVCGVSLLRAWLEWLIR